MVLVTGATGFVGSHLVKKLAAKGMAVRALVRNPDKAGRLPEGVEAARGDINDRESLVRAASGCDAVIHLVGIIQEGPGYTFESVHVEGTRNMVDAAKEAGTVRHFIYQSSLGTSKDAQGGYFRTKYQAEEIVKASGLDYTITRPSIIYGPGGDFITKTVQLFRQGPVVPIIGPGESRLQPVFIDDITEAISRLLLNPEYFGRTLELGGPEQLTFNEVMERIREALGSRKGFIHLPLSVMLPVVSAMEKFMPNPPVTTGQIAMLQRDNVCSLDGMKAIGITPIRFADGLKTFLRHPSS